MRAAELLAKCKDGMTIAFHADSADFVRAARMFDRLPDNMKRVVARRVMGRVGSMMKTRIARHASSRTGLPQHMFAGRMKVSARGESDEVRVSTDFPTRYAQFGGKARSMKKASGKLRGSYAHTFIATMKSGHTGIFQRTTDGRLPIEELYGPNIARHINVDLGGEYTNLVVEIAEKNVLPRLLHEIGRAVGG